MSRSVTSEREEMGSLPAGDEVGMVLPVVHPVKRPPPELLQAAMPPSSWCRRSHLRAPDAGHKLLLAYIHTHSVDGWEGSGDNMVITTRVREKWREELVRWFRCVRNGGRNVMELLMDLFCGRTQEEISSL